MSYFKSVSVDNIGFGPFGDLVTADLTPVLQMDFVNGLNIQTTTYSTTGTGSIVEDSANRLRLRGGTFSGNVATFQSRRPARYRPGQGVIARFTAVFTNGVANNIQLIGMGNVSGANSPFDGYFFGFNETQFGILHANGASEEWIYQSTWNGDKADGTGPSGFNMVKTNGNVFQIKYPFLGYGNITFWCQNSNTSEWILLHTIKYANSSPGLQINNPSLNFFSKIQNTGSTSTNVALLCGSVGVFTVGERSFRSNPRWSIDNNKSAITTETNILTLKNATTYNGRTNRGLIRLSSVSFGSSAASGIAVLRFKINPALGGVPAYTPISGSTVDNGATIVGNSIASYDVAGTTVTGGTYIYSISVDNPASSVVDLEPFDLFIAPGETLTISAFSSATSQIGVSINWVEDI